MIYTIPWDRLILGSPDQEALKTLMSRPKNVLLRHP